MIGLYLIVGAALYTALEDQPWDEFAPFDFTLWVLAWPCVLAYRLAERSDVQK